MVEYEVVRAPQMNANDVELLVLEWRVAPWDFVLVGDVICELETAKSTEEIVASKEGFVFYSLTAGTEVSVGEPLFFIFQQKDESQAEFLISPKNGAGENTVSERALGLMNQYGLKPSDFPRYSAIDLATVVAKVRSSQLRAVDNDQDRDVNIPAFSPEGLIVIGEENMAILVLDAIAAQTNLVLEGAIVSNSAVLRGFDLPLFKESALPELRDNGLRRAFLCAPDEAENTRVKKLLDKFGIQIDPIAHPTASVSPSASLGQGVFVGAGTVIGPLVSVGAFSRILSTASIAHHSSVEEHVIVADGCKVGGNVKIEKRAELGIGVNVNRRVTIGENSTIVSGSTVIKDVPPHTTHRLDGTLVKKSRG